MTKNEHVEWLEMKLTEYERDLARAEAEVERLRPIVTNLRGTIEVLAGSNGARGENGNHSVGVRLLKRNSQFSSLTTSDAVRQILETSVEPLHYEELTKMIFQIDSESDFRKAKRSISSELSSGARKGYWRTVGSGRYARADKESMARKTL